VHELDRFRIVVLDMSENASGSYALDLDLIGPVRVVFRQKFVSERLQFGDVRLGARNVPGPASPSARANKIIASAHGKR
jgi:hypothetical protein